MTKKKKRFWGPRYRKPHRNERLEPKRCLLPLRNQLLQTRWGRSKWLGKVWRWMCTKCQSTSAAPHSLLQPPSGSSEPHRWKEYLKACCNGAFKETGAIITEFLFFFMKVPENIRKMLGGIVASPRYQICTWSTSTRGRTRREISKFQAASIPKCEGHGIGAPREQHGQPARLVQCATASNEFRSLLEKKTSTFLHFLASRIITVPNATWAVSN